MPAPLGGGAPAPTGVPGFGSPAAVPAPAAGRVPAPFGQPSPSQRPSAAPAPAASADPFAAAAPAAATNEVRLVIDDKSDVTAEEVGRKSRGKIILAAVAALLAGVAVGWLVGGTARERSLYNLVLADAKDIYSSVDTASATITKAQSLVNEAVKAAAPGPGKGAKPDFAAMEGLRALQKPFEANAFARKHYRAFNESTVDALFTYYNNVNMAWSQIQALAATTLPKGRRAELESSAKTATDFATQAYGCVPFTQNKQFACGMVTVAPSETEGKVSVTAGGRTFDKTPYAGEDLSSNPSNYVMQIDKGRSKDLLAAGASAFQQYARDLTELKKLLDDTVEVQGRLIREIGDVAKLDSL